MREYIKMGFGVGIGLTIWATLVGTINDKLKKDTDTDKTESNNDKVEESAK